MSQYPSYVINPSGGDLGHYGVPQIDMDGMLKQLMENNGAVLGPSHPYLQQNKIPGQYFIPVPTNYAPLPQQYLQMAPNNGSNIYYLSQPTFASGDGSVQYGAGQMMAPVQMPPTADMTNLNGAADIHKTTDPNGGRSKKKPLKVPMKQEPRPNIDPNEDVPRDTKNRPLIFFCPECSKRFSTQSRLDNHFNCHTGDRPYICEVCQFAFTQKSYLMRHAAVHREERCFECELCKKTYKHYGSLANHRKTHRDGNKSGARHSNGTGGNVPITTKVEMQSIDLNNNSSSSAYLPSNNPPPDYLYQSQQEIKQEIDQNQSYEAQFNTDMFSSSFQNHPADMNTSSFLDQLNYHGPNFYPLMPANTNSVSNLDLSQHDNNLLALDSTSQPISLAQSSVKEEAVITYTV